MDVIHIRTSASDTSHKGKHAKSKVVITAITGERLNNTAEPDSNASVRGSEVSEDMAALTESVANQDDTSQARFNRTSDKTASKKKRRHPAKGTWKSGLDHTNSAKVEEWLSLDQKALHPKFMSTRKHFLRIINTLDNDEKMMEVSNYMTLNDVVDVYLNYNIKCRDRDYIWKNIWAVELELNKTLEENKLIDKSEIIDEIGLDYFPTILLYFKDGFENEPKMELDISKHATPINSTLLAPPKNY